MRKVYSLFVVFLIPIMVFALSDKQLIYKFMSDHIRLGVLVKDADNNQLKKLDIDVGALIVEVMNGSEAERIGLEKGDVIYKIDDKEVKDADGLHDLITGMDDEEKTISISVYRNGNKKTFKATLSKKSDNFTNNLFSGSISGDSILFNRTG